MRFDNYIDDLKVPNDWACTSYNNDELASFQVNGLHIWVDSHCEIIRAQNSKNIYGYTDKLAPRFMVTNSDGYNHLDECDDQNLLETNDFQEVITFAKSYKFLEFEYEGVCITDPFSDETGRFAVCPFEYYGINIDYLTKLYLEYCTKQKIECVDAMEYLSDPNILNDNQNLWMKQFVVAWDRAQSKEDKKERENSK
jgi:hypothetical protein